MNNVPHLNIFQFSSVVKDCGRKKFRWAQPRSPIQKVEWHLQTHAVKWKITSQPYSLGLSRVSWFVIFSGFFWAYTKHGQPRVKLNPALRQEWVHSHSGPPSPTNLATCFWPSMAASIRVSTVSWAPNFDKPRVKSKCFSFFYGKSGKIHTSWTLFIWTTFTNTLLA